MKNYAWIAASLLTLLVPAAAPAHPLRFHFQLSRVARQLHGQLLDFTENHGGDRRIYSRALGEKRDLYVYLPPHFDPGLRYPLMIWLHGFAQDEFSFLNDVVQPLDRAIACGKLPPMIIAAPDGSFHGHSCFFTAGSFYLNTRAGAFEDFLMVDVWNFLVENFPIRPEREAHVIAGVSMGAGSAFNKGIKFQDRFKVVLGIFPPVNVRWENCRGRYMRNFSPCCWGWKTSYDRPLEVVGRFYGLVTIRQFNVVTPLYGKDNPDTQRLISQENPIEMLEAYNLQEGRLAMYIGYGGRDEFNIDAQVESFLHVARQRGLTVQVGYEPRGRHDRATAYRLLPGALSFLNTQLAPYGPCPGPVPASPPLPPPAPPVLQGQ